MTPTTARRRALSILFLLGASTAMIAADAFADPPRVVAPAASKAIVAAPTFDVLLERQGKLMQSLEPLVRKRLDAAGREVFTRLAQPVPAGAPPRTPLEAAREVAKAPSFANLGSLANGDIEAVAFVVLMQAARSSQDDLKAILAELKVTNVSRAELRARLGRRKRAGAPDGGADSLSEWSEQQQLRLQIVLDRLSRAEAALSNLSKKVAETQSSIIGNIK